MDIDLLPYKQRKQVCALWRAIEIFINSQPNPTWINKNRNTEKQKEIYQIIIKTCKEKGPDDAKYNIIGAWIGKEYIIRYVEEEVEFIVNKNGSLSSSDNEETRIILNLSKQQLGNLKLIYKYKIEGYLYEE